MGDMLSEKVHFKTSRGGGINLTPIIDIVFLLMIFFMLVCQFFIAENFEVAVPDKIDSAEQKSDVNEKLTTLTVMKDKTNGVIFAVGSEKFVFQDGAKLADKLSSAMNRQLGKIEEEAKTVCLRIDKDVEYEYSQIALAAVSGSIATDIQLLVISD